MQRPGSDDPRRAGRRQRSPGKVSLPALRNPARCSNQFEAEVECEWDEHRRHRRPRRHLEPLPQLAYVYLPAMFPTNYLDNRSHRGRPTNAFGRHDREYGDDSSDNSSCDSSEDDAVPLSPKTTMRSQRMRSLAVISKLQHAAATTLQREYRAFRTRRANQNRRNQRLVRQGQDFLHVFLLQEMASLVPVCLLEVLRETRLQEAERTKRREDIAVSLATNVLSSLVDECIHDVFHNVLQSMVKCYLSQRIDLSRAATPSVLAVAADIFDDWTKELVSDLLPEAVVELALEYTEQQQHEVIWEALLHDQLESVALETANS